jgi:hypothetical protein
MKRRNTFEIMKPAPKKIYTEKKSNRGGATTSRVLTQAKRLASLRDEMRLYARHNEWGSKA